MTECSVCGQKLREPTADGHHQEKSPIDRTVCLGCWIFALEIEKFLIRKTDHGMWTLQIHDLIKGMLLEHGPVLGVPYLEGSFPRRPSPPTGGSGVPKS